MAHRKQKALDARGEPFESVSIFRAIRSGTSGRANLLRKGDTFPFWPTFFSYGLAFALLMWLFRILLGYIEISGGGDPLSFASAAQFVVQFVFFGGFMAAWASLYNWRTPAHAVDAMTAAGLCPGCAYSLEGVEPAPDGCTVCPECGAAWRMNG